MEHSKLPWEALIPSSIVLIGPLGGGLTPLIVDNGDGRDVCYVLSQTPEAEGNACHCPTAKANAKLIERAVNFHDQLVRLAKQYREYLTDIGLDRQADRITTLLKELEG